jgi:hypothetical protein
MREGPQGAGDDNDRGWLRCAGPIFKRKMFKNGSAGCLLEEAMLQFRPAAQVFEP